MLMHTMMHAMLVYITQSRTTSPLFASMRDGRRIVGKKHKTQLNGKAPCLRNDHQPENQG